ncbi:MAG TPA: hypothetical protein VNV37_06895, partial [Solirubrobacteraceae bacterium]|nr:hypothetical protein [Solirubrobacteraceae bacterium]
MTRHAEARLFAALDLPFAIRAQLAGWARTAAASVRAGARASAETTHTQLTPAPGERETHARMRPRPPTARGQLRLLEPDTLHVTLCFLGNRPVGEIEALGGALAEACAEAPPVGSLALGAPLWLPPRHPRALAVELHDTPDHALAELQAAIAAALAAVCDLAHSSSSSSS